MPVVDSVPILDGALGALAQAEADLARGELERARAYFESAAAALRETEDRAARARALVGLGRVLLGLEEPASRDVLEDAGTLFEDLADESGMREVQKLLLIAEGSVERESPRSFHSVGTLRWASVSLVATS